MGLKSSFFAFGLILAIVGVLLIAIPFIPVSGSIILVDDLIYIPEFSDYVYSVIFTGPTTLQISFAVTDGGDRTIDFIVMDETNYERRSEDQTYEYYVAPSRQSVFWMNSEWVPPTNKRIYFVWDNHLSDDPKLMAITLSYPYSRSLLPPLASTFGVALLLVGLLVIRYGIRPPTPSAFPREI